jgi:hypothetical protein
MNMSRIATSEYIGAKRRAYEASKPDKRRLIIEKVGRTYFLNIGGFGQAMIS